MEDKTTLGYFLSLLDECERIIDGDRLSEKHRIVDYALEEKKEETFVESISECRNCSSWRNRVKYASPLLNNPCSLMCIVSSPEGISILSSQSADYFEKWMKAIGLALDSVSLTALIKCPCEHFNKESADRCKGNLKKEMIDISPRNILLMGEDIAKYMLRKNLPIEALRGKRYLINNIPTFVTYSPHDLVMNRALRAPIWEDLKIAKEAL